MRIPLLSAGPAERYKRLGKRTALTSADVGWYLDTSADIPRLMQA